MSERETEEIEILHYGDEDLTPYCDPSAGLHVVNGALLGGTMVFDWDAVNCSDCLRKFREEGK